MTQIALFEQARTVGDLTSLANRHTSLRRIGSELKGPCPLCGDGDDRFYVTEKDGHQYWGCRVCMPGYHDITALVAKLDGIGMAQAARSIVGDSHILGLPAGMSAQVHTRRPAPVVKPPSTEWQNAAWLAIMPAAAKLQQGYRFLNSGEYWPNIRAARFLLVRGIDAQLANKYMLGFCEEDIRGEDGSWYPAGITIPHIIRQMDRPVLWGVKVRRPSNASGQKYRSYQGSAPGTLFNIGAESRSKNIFVCEGEFDAIVLQAAIDAAGLDANAVTLGSASAKPRPEQWTHKLGHVWRLIVDCDSDDAGKKSQARWLDAYPHATSAKCPIGDKSDYLQHHGQESLIEWLKGELA